VSRGTEEELEMERIWARLARDSPNFLSIHHQKGAIEERRDGRIQKEVRKSFPSKEGCLFQLKGEEKTILAAEEMLASWEGFE